MGLQVFAVCSSSPSRPLVSPPVVAVRTRRATHDLALLAPAKSVLHAAALQLSLGSAMKPSRKKTCRDRREALHRIVARLKLSEQEQQLLLKEQQLRAEVLADLCQVLDSIAQLRRSYSHIQPGSGADGTPADEGLQQVSGQPTSVSWHDGVPNRHGQAQYSTSRMNSTSQLMRSVPNYCCSADLISKATPELAQLAVSMTVADVSKLLTDTFYELAAQLEFLSRSQSQSSAAAAETPAGAGTHLQELGALVDGFYGTMILVMVLHPMPLVQAMCLNHRTQQLEAPTPAHWMGVVQRLKLTSKQASYLVAAQQKITHMRRGNVWQISMLAQEAASPSLLVLAAQTQYKERQTQAQPEAQQQQQAPLPNPQAQQKQKQQRMPPARGSVSRSSGSGLTRSSDPTSTPEPASPAKHAAGGSSRSVATVVEDKPFKEVQLTCQLHHLTTYSTFMALVVLDALTPMQKAQWLVSSYPWVPGPVILCTCASQLLKQASEQQPASTPCQLYNATDDDPHMQAVDSRVQHLLQRRLQWQQQLEQEQQQAQAAADPMEMIDALFGRASMLAPPCGP